MARGAPREMPAIATLDDRLWEHVGRVLVERRRVEVDELESALAEHRRTRAPLDEILIARGSVSRQAVASAVLVAQLGDGLEEQLRERAAVEQGPEDDRLPDVPTEPGRLFVLVCLAVDVGVFSLAVIMAALARSNSSVPLPPGAWGFLFFAGSLGVYWAWRYGTFRTKLRPWADALLVAGATSLAGLLVIAIRSQNGESGAALELLPLWAFATVYWVAGRMAFYVAWAPHAKRPAAPGSRPKRKDVEVADAPVAPAAPRALEVVPLRPDLWGLVEELREEVEAVVREQELARAS